MHAHPAQWVQAPQWVLCTQRSKSTTQAGCWWRTNCQKENMSGEGFLDTAGPSRSCSMRRPTRFKPTRNCLRGVT